MLGIVAPAAPGFLDPGEPPPGFLDPMAVGHCCQGTLGGPGFFNPIAVMRFGFQHPTTVLGVWTTAHVGTLLGSIAFGHRLSIHPAVIISPLSTK